MKPFFKTSLVFLLGLAAILFIADGFMGFRLARSHGKGLIAPEVFVAVEAAHKPSPIIRAIYLGDSVAEQLFPPSRETRPDERFLTCNQAISVAGQYYLLEDALTNCPDIRDVYLFYYPGSFTNDLDSPPFTNDFFCGFFHKPDQIRETFQLTKDYRLLAVHIGRYMLPNVMGINSGSRPALSQLGGPRASGLPADPGGGGSEPLLDLMNSLCGKTQRFDPPIEPDAHGRLPIALSPVSSYYLSKMRELCIKRHAALHVLPCPCSDARPISDPGGVYDEAILYVEAAKFADRIHLRNKFIDEVRKEMIERYHLLQIRSRQ
jgi:hypothetical protein